MHAPTKNLREVYARACALLCALLHSAAPLVRISLNCFLEVPRADTSRRTHESEHIGRIRRMTVTTSDPIHLGMHPAAWNRVAIDHGGVRSDDAVVNRTRAVTLSGGVRAVGRD